MNSQKLKPIAVLTCHLLALSAHALTLPVSEDTVSNVRGMITLAAGKAATLLINSNQSALLKFDLASLPSSFAPLNVTSARLKLFITKTRDPGELTVSVVTSPWTETVSANTPAPSFEEFPFARINATNVQSKHFVTIDVTSQMIAALGGALNFGFLIQGTRGQTFIAAKEGPSQGPSAELEIDANLSRTAAGDGSFPGSLVIGGNLDLGGLMRQGSETGTAEPAGGGLIVRRIQSTNSAAGSIVARTDRITLERDGTLGGWRIVTQANSGNVTIVATGLNDVAAFPTRTFVLGPNPYATTTNTLFTDAQGVVQFRCSFGSPDDVGHHTDVSLMRSPNQNSPVWIGNMISSYNQ